MNTKLISRRLVSTAENAEFRSGFGDMHAYRDATLMTEHVALLLSHGLIDDIIAAELSKSFSKNRKYPVEYLRSHPNYTGVRPAMSTFSTADRHQRKRDKDMLQFIKDYEAGQIDEWGITNTQKTTLDSTRSENDASQPVHFTELGSQLEVLTSTTIAPLLSQRLRASPVPEPSDASACQSPLTRTPVSTPSLARVLRTRRFKLQSSPHELSSGTRDYSGYTDGELLAECRRRRIARGGDVQVVRNRLIQDDVNMKQDLPREKIKHLRKTRGYEHRVPADLAASVEQE